MKSVAIIPARLGSTRLPRKVLREICGRPMLAHVYEAARGCAELAQVIVATDSEEVLALCRQNQWPARMTSAAHTSGTERVNEVANSVAADVYINLQGDEPLARPEHVGALLELMRDPAIAVGTLKTPCSTADINNPNAVKVVTDSNGRALYFSRATLPYDRDAALAGAPNSNPSSARYFKHLGFYAYRKPVLERFCALGPSALEQSERLEQLRFLENGIAIRVAETRFDTVGVDTEDDLRRVEKVLRGRPPSFRDE